MDNGKKTRRRRMEAPGFDMTGHGRQNPSDPPIPHPLRQSSSASQNNNSTPHTQQQPERGNSRRGPSRNDGTAVASADNSHDGSPAGQQRPKNPNRKSDASGNSGTSIMTDAKKWFDNSNNNPTATFEASPPDGSYFGKRESSSDDANPDLPLMSPQLAPPFVSPEASFLPATLIHATTRSSSSEDYRSVIDDLTIENKRLKEQLKRYQQNANRDVLENEKLFEIKMHGLPRRKKQELEATLRDFAAGLADSTSNDSSSRLHRDKSSSSKDHSQQAHKHHHHHHHNGSALYSLSGSRSKNASNSSSRSRPVDSAYASMSMGGHSAGTSLTRPPYGDTKARTSSEQKVERYLKDIPEGLYPQYSFNGLGDNEKKKLIVRRLEQLFTGKIGGRYSRQARFAVPESANVRGTTSVTAAADERSTKSADARKSSSRSGTSGDSGSTPAANMVSDASMPAVSGTVAVNVPVLTSQDSLEPVREARIQSRSSGHKQSKSHDNGSASNSHSNGDESGNGNGNGSGSGHGNVPSHSATSSGNGNGKHVASSVPDQRPTRPLDLDPDRVQVPADNMEYIRHLGLVPPEIGPQSVSNKIDVSPDADGWVYLNLLANLAQLHILNVAPDFIRQAVVEKSTKFQLSPDGQKIRWRGGMDGTKFSSDSGSSGDRSQHSQSTDADDGSDETGQRKRAKTSENNSASAQSSSKKQSKAGLQDSNASSSFHYKPLFVHQNSSPLVTSGEEMSSQDSDLPEAIRKHGSRVAQSNTKSRNRHDAKSKTKSSSISNSNGNSNTNMDASRHDSSRSGSSKPGTKRKTDGVIVYYSGMPFCTDLAGDSTGEASPTTNETSTLQTQDSMDAALQGRPTVHRSSSGSYIPFRPLTDYMSLSMEEWAGLGLLGIGTVGRNEPAASVNDNMSSSDSFISNTSNQDGRNDDLMVLDYSSETDATSVDTEEPLLEASGINRVFPEDHFALRVTTERPFDPKGYINACEDDDVDVDDSVQNSASNPRDRDSFSMASLANRVASLKQQTPPVSAAVTMKNKAPSVVINYVSAIYQKRKPAELPRPAMFYPPFSSTSESEEDEDLLDSEGGEDEDESLLASSSVISRRANPHYSVNNASLASHAVMSSGEDGDVEADGSRETMELEDSI
ncbi:uncharacterized protein SPSK_00392 [Sporothrix schenckii 1099-18]|uniref:Frequency clock protein n=1 Tax=Sporothrix schenckii 1099-18 TaxID=1397361 RepID=A0A0F2LTZ6_SPOSC|nr:uncharacterized protein SPSK_00392 [Sporothrix schenckii 1099-18]KJR79980.1 hypothetical protein SPSK_00392 [Sporothrix schenckii 1099-18]